MPTVDVPLFRAYPTAPALKPDAMRDTAPYIAKPAVQTALGYPAELLDNWQPIAIQKMGELIKQNKALRVYLDACVKCGACTDKCHYFIGTADPKNMPVARQDLFRNVYRRYFTLAGRFFPKLVGATDLTKAVLDDWYTYYHQCSQCRRCAVFCPYGIDTAEIAMAAREILDVVGKGQKYCNEVIGKVLKTGNNLGIPEPALRDTLASLEDDIYLETGVTVRLPLDNIGAEVLLITPSADFFAEPHIDGLIGYAKVFHQAGIAWTLSSYAAEAANFGLFTGSYENMQKIAQRIREAAIALRVKRIVFGECGHAWRVAYHFLQTLVGDFNFLDPRYPIPQHICEVTYDLLQRNALRLDKSANDKRILTFHDSCNIARASRMGQQAGGQFTIPREIIKQVANHFYEMPVNTTHDKTFCCGGGGGLLTDDLLALRVKGALPRMEALHAVVKAHEVTHLIAICAICKTQFNTVMPYYGFNTVQVMSLHQLVGDALVMR
ncbi:sulfate reduction electron transfer complex DsrMKJOP subunit DsrK [Beggiatoa leptomitoformis]|uniref:(Fe-S)-binding protein n=1 Tax=Beggiatoa leptomitoformis TaxID=288004 RepID=A0A2N9YIL5_9GAMM|nr:(Fe-S)-binding protein [Beggiatoa leptomitoformis]ALG67565.1 (Fe-S)-binding protein [Beggiatoa leptomitoformis]AUI70205.1 (Fe-S)-binding protein [Beggiatoa leptomitoformis]